MGLVVAPLLEGDPKYAICITLAGLGPTRGRTKITYDTYLYKYLSIHIYIYLYQDRVASGRFALAKVCQGMLRSSFDSFKVRSLRGRVGIGSGFGSGSLQGRDQGMTDRAALPFFFSEFARSVCGAGASQASASIYRAKLTNDLLSIKLQAYRALTHHLGPTLVGSGAWEKLGFKRMQTCRRLQKSLYTLIICLGMSNIKAYMFASYDISTSPSGAAAGAAELLLELPSCCIACWSCCWSPALSESSCCCCCCSCSLVTFCSAEATAA